MVAVLGLAVPLWKAALLLVGWFILMGLGMALLVACGPIRRRDLVVFDEMDPAEIDRIMSSPGPFDPPKDFAG